MRQASVSVLFEGSARHLSLKIAKAWSSSSRGIVSVSNGRLQPKICSGPVIDLNCLGSARVDGAALVISFISSLIGGGNPPSPLRLRFPSKLSSERQNQLGKAQREMAVQLTGFWNAHSDVYVALLGVT
jgi:hypothetical protein